MSEAEFNQLVILGLLGLLGVAGLLFKFKNDYDERRAREAEKTESRG